MNVLVAYASKHGSTREIAEVIAGDLRIAGLDVDLQDAADVTALDEYDAVVLGSAIYIGQWQKPALDLIEQHGEKLKQRKVWLFSSGPIGDDPFPAEEPPMTADLLEQTGAFEHQSFTGKLDRHMLGFGERLVTTVLRAPEGDFRDWDVIRAWAVYIARSLQEAQSEAITSPE